MMFRIGLFLLVALLLAACSDASPTAIPTAPGAPPTQAQESGALPVVSTPTQPPATILPTDSPPPTPIEGGPPAPTQTPAGAQATPDAVALPDPGPFTWRRVFSGFVNPLAVTHAGDGSGRLFVVEQPGRIQILKDGVLMAEPFLDITNRVGSQGFEQGLLGLAFHPNYAQNGFFYVNYTDLRGNTAIARFQVSAGDPDRSDPASEKRLLLIDQPFGNHNGGMVAFGPDGYLYLGLGDGGSAGDPLDSGQSLNTLLGKILRIDVDNGDPYAIPPDNPFANGGGKPEIWATGLRNPWRFAFDRLTGDLYIADVGQNQWEEINFAPAGAAGLNYGWRFFEGSQPYKGSPPQGLNWVAPAAEYDHSQGCSVTGGVIYRGQNLPAWQGVYLYGDFCSGRVWGLLRGSGGEWLNRVLFEGMGRITSFGEDQAGEVYLVDQAGTIYRLEAQ